MGFSPVCFYQISIRILVAPHSPADQFAQVDVNGHAWVAGSTFSSLDGHSNAGGQDIFLMKFDGEGVHQWTHQHGGEGDDVARALQADGVRRPSFWIFSMEENIRILYGVHVRHHHLSSIAQSGGCLYKIKIQVKIWYLAIESTEWDHVWMFGAHENPEESWRLTWDLANSIHLPETKKESNPRVLENL